MYSPEEISSEALAKIKNYPGLIGILIYVSGAKVFEEIIKRSYHELHMMSGTKLVLVAGRPDWMSDDNARRIRADVMRRMDDAYVVRHMTLFEHPDSFSHAEGLISLQRRFELKVADLPCIVLLERIEETHGYVFTFDANRINLATDELISELGQLFEIIEEQTSARPVPNLPRTGQLSSQQYSELLDWRREAMDRIAPSLNRLRVIRSVRKIAPAAIGLAGVLSGMV